MRQKIGTVLDQRLIRRAKVYAGQRGQALSAVLEDALRVWLDRAEAKPATPGLMAGTAGNMATDEAVLAALMAEDPFDAP